MGPRAGAVFFDLSPLYYLFSLLGGGGGGPLVLFLLYVPMIYCAVCAYFAMFRMKLCDFYALHPHHSDVVHRTPGWRACRLVPFP